MIQITATGAGLAILRSASLWVERQGSASIAAKPRSNADFRAQNPQHF